jgi:hypothetical protein
VPFVLGQVEQLHEYYQPYLKELRNRDPGDAVTDAATALQDVLTRWVARAAR